MSSRLEDEALSLVSAGSIESDNINFCSAEQQDAFLSDGFMVIESFASTQDVTFIRAVAEDIFENRVGFERGAQFDMLGKEDGERPAQQPQILNPSEFRPALRQTATFRKAEALARDLLGPTAGFVFDHMILKPPLHGSPTPWHQDEAFRDPAFDYREISIWVALQPVDLANGCMAFLPGTHRQPVLPHRSPNNDPRVHALECFAGFEPADAVHCPLPSGGCTVHTGRTLHGAGPNQTDRPRYAYVMIFETPPTPSRTTRDFPWRHVKRTARQEREYDWVLRSDNLPWQQRLKILAKRHYPNASAELLRLMKRFQN